MSKTRAEVITKVLRSLMVLGVGQPQSAEDTQAVEDIIDPAVSELEKIGVIVIDDAQAIRDEFFLPFVAYLAAEIAPDFGVSQIDGMTAKQAREAAIERLHVANRMPYTGATLQTEFY